MRTAVVLLILLSLTAIPGSLLPQRNVASNPFAVTAFFNDHPRLAPVLDRLGLFDVYASSWFAAVYLLLMVSMTGCVLPRCVALWRDMRSPTPPAPARLAELAGGRRIEMPVPVPEAIAAVSLRMREQGLKPRTHGNELRAERGRVRELGNVAFHLSLLVLLVGVALGKLTGYEGRVVVMEDTTFTNTVSQYDEFTPSVWTDIDGIAPVSVSLDRFDATFETAGQARGEPRSFEAMVRWSVAGGEERRRVIRPNQPLDVGETKFFLTGHGYAPRITVRDGTGQTVYSGATVFYPSDSTFASDGVVKVPDARPGQLAFQGLFLPTAVRGSNGVPLSEFPAPVNPRLLLTAWTGDLGLDDGEAQNVGFLDTSGLTRVGDAATSRQTLAVGESVVLPDGLGRVTFDGYDRFVNFQVAYDPGKEISLVAGLMLLLGLIVSLVVPRRRVWAHVERGGPDGSASVVTMGGRAMSRRLSDVDRVVRDVDRLAASLPGVSHPNTRADRDQPLKEKV